MNYSEHVLYSSVNNEPLEVSFRNAPNRVQISCGTIILCKVTSNRFVHIRCSKNK